MLITTNSHTVSAFLVLSKHVEQTIANNSTWSNISTSGSNHILVAYNSKSNNINWSKVDWSGLTLAWTWENAPQETVTRDANELTGFYRVKLNEWQFLNPDRS